MAPNLCCPEVYGLDLSSTEVWARTTCPGHCLQWTWSSHIISVINQEKCLMDLPASRSMWAFSQLRFLFVGDPSFLWIDKDYPAQMGSIVTPDFIGLDWGLGMLPDAWFSHLGCSNDKDSFFPHENKTEEYQCHSAVSRGGTMFSLGWDSGNVLHKWNKKCNQENRF